MKHRLNGYLRKNSQTFGQYFVKDPNCGNTLDPDYYSSAPLAVLYTEKELWTQLNYTARKVRIRKRERKGERERERVGRERERVGEVGQRG